jgi:hypothetical protein
MAESPNVITTTWVRTCRSRAVAELLLAAPLMGILAAAGTGKEQERQQQQQQQ